MSNSESIFDNPDLDNTPDAHPAWHRGRLHGAAATALALEHIARGADHAPGEDGIFNAAADQCYALNRENEALRRDRDMWRQLYKELKKNHRAADLALVTLAQTGSRAAALIALSEELGKLKGEAFAADTDPA
jgi:hypothetical protein